MKRLFLLYFAVFVCSIVQMNAQNSDDNIILRYEAIEDKGASLFSTKDMAEVIIQCKNTYFLTFKIKGENILDLTPQNIVTDAEERYVISSLKSKVTAVLAKKRLNSDDVDYVFWFRTGGDYKNVSDKRVLQISYNAGDRQNSLYINLRDIAPKTRNRFRVFNPDDANDGTVFQEHNVKAQKYYLDCNYLAARQEYILASYCDASEIEKEAVNIRIETCDKIISLTNLGEELISKGMYSEAAEKFLEAGLLKGGADKYLSTRYYYCTSKFRNSSAIQFQNAQMLMSQRNFLAAKELFDKVAEMNSPESKDAADYSKQCEDLARKRKNKESLIGFMFGIGDLKTVGLINASYKESVGAYWTLSFNTDCFGLGDYNPQEHARIDFTAGPTYPLVKASKVKDGASLFQGLWIDGGVGISVVNSFRPKTDFREWCGNKNYKLKNLTSENVDEYLKTNPGTKKQDCLYMGPDFAITPELGLMVKIWQFGLRVSYRHHIDVAKRAKTQFNNGVCKATDLLGSSEFTVGAGFCF